MGNQRCLIGILMITWRTEMICDVCKKEQIENDPVDVLGCWNWLANNYPDIAMEYQDGDGDNR